MARDSTAGTSPSLLGRLARSPADQGAWAAFVETYGRMIYRWCRGWGLQDADAEDVTQAVLAKLAVHMRSFGYDPTKSFRAWLKTLAHHAWYDFVEARRRSARAADPNAADQLSTVEARDDLARRLEEAFDFELLEEATARVRLRVAPHTWEAYRLTAIEGLSGADVAARLGMLVSRVFAARSKVQRLLREEIQRLEGA